MKVLVKCISLFKKQIATAAALTEALNQRTGSEAQRSKSQTGDLSRVLDKAEGNAQR